jgi:hypothetical protein
MWALPDGTDVADLVPVRVTASTLTGSLYRGSDPHEDAVMQERERALGKSGSSSTRRTIAFPSRERWTPDCGGAGLVQEQVGGGGHGEELRGRERSCA